MWRAFLVLLVGSLALLTAMVIPVAFQLLRRIGEGTRQREALLRNALEASDLERRRIAASLHDFNRMWGRRVLGQGAIVLLVTDGLEREQDSDLAFEIDRLHRSCRRLVWLNPLLRFDGFEARAWGIRTMLPHVDEFRPIHSLEAMGELVAALDGRGPARMGRAA